MAFDEASFSASADGRPGLHPFWDSKRAPPEMSPNGRTDRRGLGHLADAPRRSACYRFRCY
jgi:hypothetical protein